LGKITTDKNPESGNSGPSVDVVNREITENPSRGRPNRIVILLLIVAIILVGTSLWVRRAHSSKSSAAPSVAATPKQVQNPLSRQVLVLTEGIIKDVKPPPTTAALQYAYVSSAYDDGLTVGKTEGAIFASKQVLIMLYPAQTERINQAMANLASVNTLHDLTKQQASPELSNVVATYNTRYQADGHDLVWNGQIPTGAGKWVQVSTTAPFTPRAGEWKRWSVSQPITVPPPPVVGSAEDLQELANVKPVSDARNGDDVNKINFWGGTPGTETPSGIWQNQIYNTIKSDLPADSLQADKVYAGIQKTAAQTMSDAFMECWKVKYTYWTARPSMRIPGLVTAMKDPPFPSYVSGHSTISKAAADVLAILVPKYAASWESMAMEARESRIKAGIHYEIDNKVGFDLGSQVASQIKQNQKLKMVL